MAHVLAAGPTARPGEDHPGRRRARGEDGMGMAMTMVVVVIVFALGAVWLTFATQSTNAGSYERRRQQAIDAANAGLVIADSALSKSISYTGTGGVSSFPGGSAEYEVAVATDSSDTTGRTKIITATGYVPNKTASTRVVRTLRQVLQLVPRLGAGTFVYAIQSGQSINTGSASTIDGDIYAEQAIVLGNSQTLNGDAYTQSSVTLGSNATITGNVWAKGNVDLGTSSSNVTGGVTTQGNLRIQGTVGNSAVATGTIENYPAACSKVGGGTGPCKQYTQVEPPPVQPLPTFQFNEANYPGLTSYSTGGAMVTALANKTFRGSHYAPSSATFDRNHTWYLSGDTTILVNGHIALPGAIVNSSPGGQTIKLYVISTNLGDITPTNNMDIPATIHTLLYGGKIGSSTPSNSITMTGAVAAVDLSLGANFNITHQALPMVAGFTFANPPVISYDLRNVSIREIPTP